jgi:hypothetical protein
MTSSTSSTPVSSVILEDDETTKSQGQIPPAKRWCFTIFQFEDDWRNQVSSVFQPLSQFCIGLEKCPKTHNMHLQGYAEFHKKCRPLTALRKVFPGIHLEKAQKPRMANIRYCSKEGDFINTFESGDLLDFNLQNIKNVFSSLDNPQKDNHIGFETLIWRACFGESRRLKPPSSISQFKNIVEIAFHDCTMSEFPPYFTTDQKKYFDPKYKKYMV